MQLVERRPVRRLPIRMTPLIDVVFILLVFFMLTSRLLPIGRIELPTLEPGESPEEVLPPEVRLLADGRLVFENGKVTLAELQDHLTQHPVKELRLSADGLVSLDQFTRTLGALATAERKVHWARRSATPAQEPTP